MAEENVPLEILARFEGAKSIDTELKALMPVLAEARRTYFRTKSPKNFEILEAVQERARALLEKHKAELARIQEESGIPEEILEAFEREKRSGDKQDRRPRESLAADKVKVSAEIEDYLADALESLRSLVTPEWLQQKSDQQCRLSEISESLPLSLVKGTRRQSEFPQVHRFLQAIRVAEDYLRGEPGYDHFGGALLVPQLAQLGARLDVLSEVGGDRSDRINSLWQGPSNSVDSTIFELLVAAGCVEKGRKIEFLPPSVEKSPDMRCHDPFPLVIECKRQRALSDYELLEEQLMMSLFERLDRSARQKSVWGTFDLELGVEIEEGTIDDIVGCLIRQRLAAHPERALTYPWGTVAYHATESRLALPGVTRAYSPNMLAYAFNWDSDIPLWDGLICKVDLEGQAQIDEVKQPVALRWNNSSEYAIKKRSWSPLKLFSDAISQIPPGEHGIVYIAYQEGTTAKIADLRLESFVERAREWEHSAAVRVSLTFLNRLYPRPLDHGRPDLIESTARYYFDYTDPVLFEEFPSCVFTLPGDN